MNLFAQMRKGLASLTLGAMASTFVVAPVSAANLGFTDDAEIPSWADEAIEELMDQGVISGNDDGSFAPNRQLNRAEVSKIIVLATGIDLDTTGGPHFPDVADSAWYYDYIETMYNQGWINGYPDGEFRPGVGINRAEVAKMAVNAFEMDQDLAGAPHFDDVTDSDWFYGYVETIYNNGCMRGYGDGTFGPSNPVTRAETAQIVYCSQLVVLGPTGPAEGTLEVVLSNDTPRGTNIPYNATSVPYTTVELTASDDSDVEISSLTFTRLGLGDNDDFDNVWLEIDGFKVGNDKSVNNDDVVELRFNPPIVVPAGQTLVADVVASSKFQLASDGTCFASGGEGCNIGHHNRLALVSADDIVSTAANIVGDFPVEGEEMEVADYEVSQLEFSRLGSDTTVDVGDNFIEIGKFRMLNASNTNKDVEVRAITFKNDGTAELEDDLENVSLYVSGEQVSAETIMDGDYVTFRLDNGVTGGYIIEDGDSRIFSIRADIVSAEKGDTINFKVDNFEDVVGVEIGTAFGVKAISGDTNGVTLGTDTNGDASTSVDTSIDCNNEDAEDNCARLRAYSIDAGDINISRDPASLGNQEYAPGSNDVVFLTARVVVDQPIIVDGIRISTLEASSSTAGDLDTLDELNEYFDNFRLFLNDKLIDTENDFTGTFGANGVGTYLDFNTTFEIAGTSVLKVVGNVQDDATTGSQVRLEVQNSAFDAPEYISTGDQVTGDQVLGSAQASFVEVEQSQLIITKTDGLSDGDRIVAGVDDVTFMKFVLDNNDSGDVNVTSVTVDALATGAATVFSNFTAAIFVDGTQQGSSKNLDTNGEATFNDLSVVIPSAGQKEFEVVVDTIESSASTALAAGTVVGTTTQICAAASKTDSMSPVTCAAGITQALVATDVISLGGDNIVVTAPAAAAATSITVDVATVDGTASGALSFVQTAPYAIGATSLEVSSANNIAVNDVLSIGTNECRVTAITGTTISIDNCDLVIDGTAAGVAGTFLLAAATIGDVIAETAAGSTIRLVVTAVDADNVENGQEVAVIEDNVALGTGNTDPLAPAVDNGNCTAAASTDNFLCGVQFALVTSGTLTVADGATIVNDTNILVANATEIEVFKVRFSAADDEVQIRDLYFTNTEANDFGDRVDFKLYNEDGQLIQEKQMSGVGLHFELANQDRIRVPKDDSVTVTVKVDVRDITKANQTGQTLVLAFDPAQGTGNLGVEAVTAATGSDLVAGNITNNVTASERYVAYRTTLTFANAATQPSFVSSTGSDSAVFRFTVTNDAAYEGILNRVNVRLSSSGVAVAAGNATLAKYSSAAYSGTPEVIATTAGVALAANANVDVDFDITGGDEVNGTNYYEVRVALGYDNTASDNDSITGSFIQNAATVFTSATLPAFVAAPAVATSVADSSIVWSDRSANGSAGSYLTGFQLVLPSQSAGVQE